MAEAEAWGDVCGCDENESIDWGAHGPDTGSRTKERMIESDSVVEYKVREARMTNDGTPWGFRV